jgi:DNA-binding Lrp family transcriptional regulator
MLDAFDRKILAILQDDARTPQREIADAVALSSSAVNRRIAAMEDGGVITGWAAAVDPAKVGRPITIIVEVSASSAARRFRRSTTSPAKSTSCSSSAWPTWPNMKR